MLEPCDRVVLSGDVRRDADTLVDEVRGVRYPLNVTAGVLLDGGAAPLEVLSASIASRWAIPLAQAQRDVLRFAWELNRHGLANVVPGRSRRCRTRSWVGLALRLLPCGRLPAPIVKRRPLDTSTVLCATASAAGALARSAAVVALAASTLLILVGALAGGAQVLAAIAVGGATGASLLLHEAGHAVALRGRPAALLLVRGRASVLHGPLGSHRTVGVAVAGPAAPVLAGVVLAAVAVAIGAPLLALAACPAVGHALSATVAARDGRRACGLPARGSATGRLG